MTKKNNILQQPPETS